MTWMSFNDYWWEYCCVFCVDGELYAGITSDFMSRDSAFFRSLGNRRVIRTEQYDSTWLQGKCRKAPLPFWSLPLCRTTQNCLALEVSWQCAPDDNTITKTLHFVKFSTKKTSQVTVNVCSTFSVCTLWTEFSEVNWISLSISKIISCTPGVLSGPCVSTSAADNKAIYTDSLLFGNSTST